VSDTEYSEYLVLYSVRIVALLYSRTVLCSIVVVVIAINLAIVDSDIIATKTLFLALFFGHRPFHIDRVHCTEYIEKSFYLYDHHDIRSIL